MYLFELPTNITCDVIFFTKTADNETYLMTQNAIKSLKESEPFNKFRIILVESYNNAPDYDVEKLILFPDEHFNYNKAINIASKYIESDYVYVSNNDVWFYPMWFSNIIYYMNIFNLDSASPFSPMPQIGPNPIIQQEILNYPKDSVIISFEPIKGFAGWGWIIKKNILNKILPQPEELSFWFVDNYMISQLQKMNCKHGCVTNSLVQHFGQKSYKFIPQSQLYQMTTGSQSKYIELLNKK